MHSGAKVGEIVLSPIRALPTLSDSAHTPGVRGSITNPCMFSFGEAIMHNLEEINGTFYEEQTCVISSLTAASSNETGVF